MRSSRTCLGQSNPPICRRAAGDEVGFRRRLVRIAEGLERARSGKVRVGIVTPGCFVGGAEMWMLGLLRGCDPALIDWRGVAVIYPQYVHPPMAAEMEQTCPVEFGHGAARRLYDECDVVILWGVGACDQQVPPRPRTSRVVFVSHGIGPWTERVFDRAEDADAWVAVSRAALRPIPEPYRSRAVVISNGVERWRVVPKIGRAEQRLKWGIGVRGLGIGNSQPPSPVSHPRPKVLGYLGRLSDEKNPKAVASTVAELPAEWVAVQVGDGLGVEGVIEHARTTAPGRIILPGATGDVGSALAAFDEMLLPSHEEACSMTCLEAWTAGVPLIATAVGLVLEHPDLVRMIPVGADPRTIAAAVMADTEDPIGTKRRTRRARAVARDFYSSTYFAAAWTRFLSELATPSAS